MLSKKYTLFIGSIPTALTPQDLKDYFKAYKGVTSIRLNKKPGDSKNNTSVIKIDNKPTFNLILSKKTLHVKGELLRVQPCYKGQQLLEIEEDISKRRIYVNRIPFGTTDGELKSAFETIGKVESCYVSTYRRRDNADFDYGFVTMKCALKTGELLESGSLKVGDHEYELKPFKFKRKAKQGVNCGSEDNGASGSDDMKRTKKSRKNKKKKRKKKQDDPQNNMNIRIKRSYDPKEEDQNGIFSRRIYWKVSGNHNSRNLRMNCEF